MNAKDWFGKTALQVACERGSTSVVAVLVGNSKESGKEIVKVVEEVVVIIVVVAKLY